MSNAEPPDTQESIPAAMWTARGICGCEAQASLGGEASVQDLSPSLSSILIQPVAAGAAGAADAADAVVADACGLHIAVLAEDHVQLESRPRPSSCRSRTDQAYSCAYCPMGSAYA